MTLMERDFYRHGNGAVVVQENNMVLHAPGGGIGGAKRADEQAWSQIIEVTAGWISSPRTPD